MSFIAINLKQFFKINNNAKYNKQLFGAKYIAYEVNKLRKSNFSILFFFLYNQLNSVTNIRLKWRGNARYEQKKLGAMSYNPKSHEIKEKCSINKTSLIE